MMKYLAVVAVLAFGPTQPAMATVQGGLVDLFAQSQANANAKTVYDYIDKSGAANDTPITASEAFSTSDTAGAPAVELASAMNANQAYAILPDAAHGSVLFSGSSIATVTAAGYTADAAASASAYGLDAFTYMFSIATPGTLTVTYVTSDNGVVSSVPTLSLTSPSVAAVAFRYLLTNGSGSAVFDLAPGDHELAILSDALSQNAVQKGAVGTTNATASERFSFVIDSAVPEPTTWLMMLVGFATLGLSNRRRLERFPRPR